MIHLFCALKCEAKPLFEHFKLSHVSDAKLFKTYINKKTGMTLTITGVGKLAAAAGVMHTIMNFNAHKDHVFLNIGIAGHATLPVGQAVIVNKIEDAASGANWGPDIAISTDLPRKGLKTFDTPSFNYSGDDMMDMEAAGFYATACRIGSEKFIHSIKIISDNQETPAKKLPESTVSKLIHQNIAVIETVLEQLEKLSNT